MSEGTRTDEKSPADPDRVARDAHEQIEVELAQKDSSLPAEQRLVLEALGHLPADLRDVFLLHHLDGLTCEQIAQRRSLTSAHVKVLLYRARHRVAESVEWLGRQIEPEWNAGQYAPGRLGCGPYF